MSRDIVTYALSINPEPWAVGNAYVRRAGGKSFAAVSPDKTLKAYKEALVAELTARGATVKPGPYAVRLWFWRENVTYIDAGGKKRTRNSPDATNMQKATEDALQDVLIENDRDVLHIESSIVERGQGVTPMVVIEVEYLGDKNLHSELPHNVLAAIESEGNLQRKAQQERIAENTWIPGQ